MWALVVRLQQHVAHAIPVTVKEVDLLNVAVISLLMINILSYLVLFQYA